MQNIQPVTSLLVASVGGSTLPVPAALTDGIDISKWDVGYTTPIRFDAATIYLSANNTGTMTGPANLYGLRNGAWWLLAALNNGSNIALTSALGFAQRVNEIAIFSRLLVACASLTGGVTYTYSAEPISIRND